MRLKTTPGVLLICLLLAFNSGSAQPTTHREKVIAALIAQRSVKSFRLKEVQSHSGGGVGIDAIITGNYIAPDKYHATLVSSSASAEVILIDGKGFIKQSGGEWQMKDADPQRIEAEFARLLHVPRIEQLRKTRDGAVKLAGQANLNGWMMYIYHFEFRSLEMAVRSKTKVWVGVSDGLPHRIEVESRLSQKGLNFIFATTTSYFDYNADITIKAPM